MSNTASPHPNLTPAPLTRDDGACWLSGMGWPELIVNDVSIEGEAAWRAWLATADVQALEAVRAALGELAADDED